MRTQLRLSPAPPLFLSPSASLFLPTPDLFLLSARTAPYLFCDVKKKRILLLLLFETYFH